MLLAIDIGNTTISFAVIRTKKIVDKSFLMQKAKSENIEAHLKSLFRKYKVFDQVMICSVVPAALRKVVRGIKKQGKSDPCIIGEDIPVPINNKYHDPKQVGKDRLLCAYAATMLYGSPVIIVDLGTAITLDLVSSSGDYEGGMIIPGIKLSAESLFRKTALLPDIDIIRKPKKLIGKDTVDSILSGIFYGYGSMISGLVRKISKDFHVRPKVIVTGGYTKLMVRFISCPIHRVEKDLVFKGMMLLNRKK